MVKFVNVILLIIFVAAALIFTAENPERVNVKFLGLESMKLPISVIVFFSAIIGILIALIYHFYAVYRLKKGLRSEGSGSEKKDK
ncbi:MAG: lipopolysaccharide assembly protein LapA domain-containing protein [Deltaproteobacteria bacterium]|nr:lipopolysaccharide assembly protein LapA domain-containing protein [Deltaproteobacteria bacterium]